MTQALLTPQVTSPAASAGKRLWWKQLLPLGSITYGGRTLTFDRPYLTDLATAFDQQAYDMVPAVLADEQNRHNMDPLRMRGEVRQVQVRDDGLYGLVDLSADAGALVQERPTLGVSVRIVEDLVRADGKRWPRALQHVLLTADPRVTGMGPWSAVDLAGDQTPTVDLTSATITPPGAPVALTDQEQKVLDGLLAKQGAAQAPAPPTTPPAPQAATPTVTPASASDALPDDVSAWTEEQLDGFLASVLDAPAEPPSTDAPSPAPVPALAGAALSTPAPGEQARIAALELSVAQSGWREERQNWVAAGVPPVLLDKAAPLLSTPARGQVDLSNGQTLDPFQVVRDLLDAAKGTVDLSGEQGTGHTPAGDEPQTLDQVRDTPVYKNWSM